jgi:hypothetical protein
VPNLFQRTRTYGATSGRSSSTRDMAMKDRRSFCENSSCNFTSGLLVGRRGPVAFSRSAAGRTRGLAARRQRSSSHRVSARRSRRRSEMRNRGRPGDASLSRATSRELGFRPRLRPRRSVACRRSGVTPTASGLMGCHQSAAPGAFCASSQGSSDPNLTRSHSDHGCQARRSKGPPDATANCGVDVRSEKQLGQIGERALSELASPL